jgi:polyphenol oxidase
MQTFDFQKDFQIIISHKSDGDFRKNSIKAKNFLKKHIKNKKFCHITLEGGTKRYLCTNPIDKEIVSDAVLTQNPDICLSLVVADCLPIVIVDQKTKARALIHAGWRGLIQNIIELAINDLRIHFNSQKSDLAAWIGPGVGSCCYQFRGKKPLQADLVGWEESLDKAKDIWKIDLKDFARRELERLDISQDNISVDKTCTCCSDKFFSHQRAKETGEVDGRFLVGVVLKYRSG